MMCTFEEFQESLAEDEFVVGDSFWLKGTRRRFEFTVTNVDPFEPSVAQLPELSRELREMVKETRSVKGQNGKTPRQLVGYFAGITDEMVRQRPLWVSVVRELCREARIEDSKTKPVKRVPRR